MSNIKKIYHDSLEQAVRDHIVGVRTGDRKDWHWTLKMFNEIDPIPKLKLILSWKFGNQVLQMTSHEILKNLLAEYKKYNYCSYQQMKYG